MRRLLRPRLRLAVALVLSAAAVVVLLALDGEGGPDLPDLPIVGDDEPDELDVLGFDPLRWSTEREPELMERAARAFSHVVYARSPGGVIRTEARVLRYADEIAAAAEDEGVSAETLGALVYLESAGRPEVMATGTPEGATGLAQILPGTATELLGMRVDLERSVALTRAITRSRRRARRARTERRRRIHERRAERARAERQLVDERFQPEASLAGAARYLRIAEERFGREDLAIAAYHMGIGNLETVIGDYVAPRAPGSDTADTVLRHGLSYARLYFDSDPLRNPRTWRRLVAFGDDSRHYLFRFEGAREIRRLAREDPDGLRRIADLQTRKASSEDLLRPESEHEPYEDAGDLRDAYDDGELVPLPNAPGRLGYRIDRAMGRLARRLEEPRDLYRGLREDALACLLYIAKETRRLSGSRGVLRVTSTVRDRPYQDLLIGETSEATRAYSLHTVGFAVDVALDFRSRAQERAFLHSVTRLKALGVIDFVIEPGAVHFTAGPDCERYRPLVDELAG